MKRKQSRRPRRPPHSFYSGDSLSEAHKPELSAAAESDGPEAMLAVIRARMVDALDKHPGDVRLLLQGADVLIRAIVAEHRLSPPAGKSLAERMHAVLRSFGDQLLPPAPPP